MTASAHAPPAISVVVPHLNQPEHLARCLASLRAQENAPSAELIVVDNGSQALPEAVCAAHGAPTLASRRDKGIRGEERLPTAVPVSAFAFSRLSGRGNWLALGKAS